MRGRVHAAEVSVSGEGVVTALTNGTATITVTATGSGDGFGTTTLQAQVSVTVIDALPPVYLGISAGAHGTCAWAASGAMYCWGDNASGQLGDGTRIHRRTPSRVVLASGQAIVDVSLWQNYGCAAAADGAAWCWGNNGAGQIGDGTTSQRDAPARVVMPAGVAFHNVTTDVLHGCGVAISGALYCWGANGSGRLGDGTTLSRSVPTPVAAPAGLVFTHIGAGSARTCARTDEGELYCWGANTAGMLGDGTTENRSAPTRVQTPPGLSFLNVDVGAEHSCAVTTTGAVYCWGRNSFGELGDGTTTNRLTPVPVTAPSGVTFVRVAAGLSVTCAITSTGAVYCWGANGFGNLGDGTTTNRATPTLVATPEGVSFVDVSVGQAHSCAVASTGAAWCWGNNTNRQLGDGTFTNRHTPTLVALPGANIPLN